MRRVAPSLEAFSGAVAAINDAGADGASWPEALKRIATVMSSPIATLAKRDAAGRIGYEASVRPDPQAGIDYVQHYHKLDRLNPTLAHSPVGTILTSRMVTPQDEFVRTEFYVDYARRYGMDECVQGHIFKGPSGGGYLGVVRPTRAGAFDREDVRLFNLLLSHMQQAMQVRLRLATLGLERDTALEVLDQLGIGVLIADARARVTYENGIAEAILRKGDGLGVDATGPRRLRAANAGQTSILHGLIGQAADGAAVFPGRDKRNGGGPLRLDRSKGGPLVVSVLPAQAGAAWNVSPGRAALVLIRTSEAAARSTAVDLRALYGLTAKEAAAAEAVAQGLGVKGAAESLGIMPSTLRTHLLRVFEKTGTSRQAELVTLVERLR